MNERETVEILAVGAHPDDVELGCGATLALLSRRGRSVGILDLTPVSYTHLTLPTSDLV